MSRDDSISVPYDAWVLIADGEKTITDLATENKLSRTYVSRMLNLTLMAPDIVDSILNGTQPKNMLLKHIMTIPVLDWKKQKELLGYSNAEPTRP